MLYLYIYILLLYIRYSIYYICYIFYILYILNYICYIFSIIYILYDIYILFTFFKNKRHAEIRQRDCTCKKEARSFDNVPVSDKVTSKSATFAH